METITKKDLVNYITDALTRKDQDSELSEDDQATKVRITKVLVKDVIQRFLDKITEELSEGNRLEFREFGVFEVKNRAPRRAQNPRTLEKVQVPAKRVVKFKVGRKMREMVENGEPRRRKQNAPSIRPGSPRGELSAEG
ncbi:MAG: HU family DNA-binding protein [Planctomycetota bacterium]